MHALDYTVEKEVECPEDDANDTTFIWATATIGGWDAIEEFVACKMYPLASSFGFSGVSVSTTPVSKIQTLLPLFPIETVFVENSHRVLAEVEIEAERILGSFSPKEHDALEMEKLLNGGRLNHDFSRWGDLCSTPTSRDRSLPDDVREAKS
jgi:hypothetical protein